MELKDAIQKRKSVRGYLPKPVTRETLRDVFALATRAVSAVNRQPWEFAVAGREVLDRIREENIRCLAARGDIIPEAPLPEKYVARQRALGKQMLGLMEIARDDKERRTWWGQRGYRFFDAPAAIFVLTDRELERSSAFFDVGAVVQNLCLSAMEYGLGTCVEIQGVMFPDVVRKHLQIPESKELVVSIAVGYPDPDFPANHVVSEREDVDSITGWFGF